jgi:hypothetical protein
MRGEGTVRCDDVLQDARYGQNAPHAGIPAGHPPVRSYLAVPVALRNGDVIGCLFFGHPEPGRSPSAPSASSAASPPGRRAIDNRLYERARPPERNRQRAPGARRGRAHQPAQGRVPRHAVARAHAADGHPRLGARCCGAAAATRPTCNAACKPSSATRAQAQLIEDLLDMSSITSGKVRLEMQPLAPAAWPPPPSNRCGRPPTPSRSHRARFPARARHGVRRRQPPAADPVEPAQQRHQSAAARRHGQVGVQRDGDHVAITVRDSGIGIAPGFLGHVFERFRQADATTTASTAASGWDWPSSSTWWNSMAAPSRDQRAKAGACFTLRLPATTPCQRSAPCPAPRPMLRRTIERRAGAGGGR